MFFPDTEKAPEIPMIIESIVEMIGNKFSDIF